MMKTYVCNSIADVYKKSYFDIINAPEISPKGLKTKELIAPQILLTNPRNRIAYHPDRKFSMKYALVESFLLFDETNELKYFSEHNKNIANFSDDGVHLSGSYGLRLSGNIQKVIDLLRRDDSTRQAVLPILSPDDIGKVTKDTPCTLGVQFLIRDNKLNMIVNMRSNDIIWGLPYDMFMFSILQEVVANEIGIEMGWYLHRPASLHIYETHYELHERVANKFENRSITINQNLHQWLHNVNLYKISVDNVKAKDLFEDLFERTILGDVIV